MVLGEQRAREELLPARFGLQALGFTTPDPVCLKTNHEKDNLGLDTWRSSQVGWFKYMENSCPALRQKVKYLLQFVNLHSCHKSPSSPLPCYIRKWSQVSNTVAPPPPHLRSNSSTSYCISLYLNYEYKNLHGYCGAGGASSQQQRF